MGTKSGESGTVEVRIEISGLGFRDGESFAQFGSSVDVCGDLVIHVGDKTLPLQVGSSLRPSMRQWLGDLAVLLRGLDGRRKTLPILEPSEVKYRFAGVGGRVKLSVHDLSRQPLPGWSGVWLDHAQLRREVVRFQVRLRDQLFELGDDGVVREWWRGVIGRRISKVDELVKEYL